jgi:signal transduction histidine kinase
MKIDRPLLQASWRSWISSDEHRPVGPAWLQWVWTALFAAALAVPFTVIGFLAFASGDGAWRNLSGWAYWYGRNFIVCITVASIIHLLFDAGRRWWARPARVAAWKGWQRTLYFSGVPMLGVLLGWPLGVWLAGANVANWMRTASGMNMIVGTLLVSLLITFMLHHWFAAKSREHDAQRRATEAQLRLLQAQIEPHFLFNTLANVQSLMDHDLPKAKQMLASFTDYLRASLGSLRSEQSAVAQELELARNYLELLRGRMEDRLRFSISADEAARAQPLPPLLLQPLVENAVVHGLEPSIDGGSVRVSARVSGGQLVLEVQDDGRGPDTPARPRLGAPGATGAGLALANIRQRLLTRYGPAATLEIQPAQPGTLARITLPLQTTPPCPPA